MTGCASGSGARWARFSLSCALQVLYQCPDGCGVHQCLRLVGEPNENNGCLSPELGPLTGSSAGLLVCCLRELGH